MMRNKVILEQRKCRVCVCLPVLYEMYTTIACHAMLKTTHCTNTHTLTHIMEYCRHKIHGSGAVTAVRIFVLLLFVSLCRCACVPTMLNRAPSNVHNTIVVVVCYSSSSSSCAHCNNKPKTEEKSSSGEYFTCFILFYFFLSLCCFLLFFDCVLSYCCCLEKVHDSA